MKITIIAAVAADGAIGREGRLLWYIRDDMRRFRRLTMGKPVVMGRCTFESMPGALPRRRNIVVTRRDAYTAPGAETAPSLEAALALCAGAEEVMIIGGAQIYAEAMPLATDMQLTRIDATAPDADTYFPPVDPAGWNPAEADGPHTADTLSYTFLHYTRPKHKKI